MRKRLEEGREGERGREREVKRGREGREREEEIDFKFGGFNINMFVIKIYDGVNLLEIIM